MQQVTFEDVYPADLTQLTGAEESVDRSLSNAASP